MEPEEPLPDLVVDSRRRALYFSRHPLQQAPGQWFKHLGMYAFRREALARVTLRSEGRGLAIVMELLAGPCRAETIAVLHHLDGRTLEQVAEVVGLSVSGVRRRLRVLRRDLADLEKP